jgi:NAD(P)-dependent dehydrogenase (short-subunit alcohol dehydrogenase family)/rhamnose utilization protein RhaD (predicted bifunctional aldolase and dehydrogenase)
MQRHDRVNKPRVKRGAKYLACGFTAGSDKALAELIRISHAVGKDRSLVQGGGGNTSVKTADGKYMYIKASGTALKDMNAKQGWRRMRLDAVLSIIEDKAIAQLDVQKRETEVVNRLLLACDDEVTGDARPSVEAHLHSFLGKCVIHLHPSTVGAYVNAKNGKIELENLFRKIGNRQSTIDNYLPPLWVPYTDPGFTLAKKIARLVTDYQKQFGKKPAILFLEKHGLLISTQSADTALRLVHEVINRCDSKLRHPKTSYEPRATSDQISNLKLCIRKAFFEATGERATISYFCDDQIAAFSAQPDAEKMLSAGVLTPDELVYANGPAMWLDPRQRAEDRGQRAESRRQKNLTSDFRLLTSDVASRLTAQINKAEKPSVAFLVKGVGLFVAGKKKIAQTVRDILAYSAFIRCNAKRLGGITSLNKRQRDFINRWESESFRKKLISGDSQGELQDRIAVVTGAGSGLGRSIAIGLVKAGAMVALLDIDQKALEETRELILNSKFSILNSNVMLLPGDVTNEANVKRAFERLLENWGGLDILVNAAGVAPAYELVDMPVDKWRFALEVNLTGYFLCAREAARIMIAQQMGGSIINLSSKSGLDASKSNTAYNATKAGEIHMARGWALELGEYGIRVNSIAPGNVFEGSKIWNPQYIKACAKKYGIKPEEVIPFYVSRTALKREIKGQDVSDAVVFLCSDKARTITGQVLVPDSGQVMVR